MADTDFDIRRDEMERDNLQRTISEVETVLAVSTPGTRPLWENLLQNAKGRIGALEKKIKDAHEARETHEREQTAVATLAQKETALSSRERETYSGFLKEDFFTKKDFERLEQFYSKTWDRLSESGKDEMSHRIWEGIRKKEYTFTELPAAVREKEAKHAYMRLRDAMIGDDDIARIPERDRSDFIRAYEAGKRGEADKILERESFKDGMFRGTESKSVMHSGVNTGRDAEGKSIGGQIAVGAPPTEALSKPDNGRAKGNLNVSDLKLDGLKLTEAPNAPSSENIPRSAVASAKTGPSLGGG